MAELKKFKQEASRASYESENPKYKTKEGDDSTTIVYESGDWKFHDNYFGGEPYSGRAVYFYKNKPVHIMVFYGWVDKQYDADEVYAFIRKALRAPGKEEFSEGAYKYTNSWEGGVDNFRGEENIYDDSKLIYSTIYLGGLVDQRRGD